MTYGPGAPAGPTRRSTPVVAALVLAVGFVLALYLIEAVDTVVGNRLDAEGIRPREMSGLVGVALAPLLHHGWDHLNSNAGPLLVLGFTVLVSGIARGLAATAVIWVIGGFGTWLIAGSNTVHLGASGVVFGWITYLLLRGFFNRSGVQILIGVLVLLVYGGVLWGVLPSSPDISWQGHLSGAVGGVIAAAVTARRREPQPTPSRFSPS